MAVVNFWAGWLAILFGLLLGTVLGLFFHRAEWLGGYDSWQRRMLRLAHISLVGTGLLNLAFALSCQTLAWSDPPQVASTLFVVGAVAMPAVCLLAAWRSLFRHLFFLPVGCLLTATADFIYRGLMR